VLFLLYDLAQALGALALLPKLSKKRAKAYLGLSLPEPRRKKAKVFLIYAVSVGEVKALSSLFQEMKRSYPEAMFYIASRTETGLAEAQRSLKEADHHFLLPFDFSWTTNALLKRIQPDALIVIEGDLWYNLLHLAKKRGALVFLVSAKISLRSYRRFSYVPFLARKLFSLFDLICAQTAVFQERFLSLGATKVIKTGNIKLGATLPPKEEGLKKELGIEEGDFVIVLGSTHAPEERKILTALSSLLFLYPKCKLFLAPRHPERFAQVKGILKDSHLPFSTYSSKDYKTGGEKVVLMDVMGKLTALYQIADVAITAGSFDPNLKGHNILEPILARAPVLFGPYMSCQKELEDLVLSFKAGMQVSIEDLSATLQSLIESEQKLLSLKAGGEKLLMQIEGSVFHTWDPLKKMIEIKSP
jgi:3-deoxy-D-manno-octulosonic-acid transferase